MGVVIAFLEMWSMYLVIVMISPLHVFERTLRTALNILTSISHLKQWEKDSEGSAAGETCPDVPRCFSGFLCAPDMFVSRLNHSICAVNLGLEKVQMKIPVGFFMPSCHIVKWAVYSYARWKLYLLTIMQFTAFETLRIKVFHFFAHLVKAMVFLVVMCGCKSWTIKKALWSKGPKVVKRTTKELILLNCGAGENSWESLRQQGVQIRQS